MGSKRRLPQRHERLYRRMSPHGDERSFQVVVGQSDLWITVGAASTGGLESIALDCLSSIRGQISAWMMLDPAFATSLSPLHAPFEAPEAIRRMYEASSIMEVGPMACVAGGVAALVAEALLPWSSDCLIENGGDSMLHSTRDRVVALLPEPGKRSEVGLVLKAAYFPLSLCSSSAHSGHSLSLGKEELAVVR